MSHGLERVAITGYSGYFQHGAAQIHLSPRALLRDLVPSQQIWSLLPETQALLTNGEPLWCGGSDWLNAGGRDAVAVSFSSSKGDLCLLRSWAESGDLSWASDAPASSIAREFAVGGPTFSPNAACASATHAIALAAQLIQDGRASVVIAGGLEPQQPEIVTAGYRQIGALSKNGICRPFDSRRDGFIPGIGGAVLILEAESHARARGAKIHGFITGWSMNSDGSHITGLQADGRTVARAIDHAMQRGGVGQLDYINAHGTGTKLNDLVESRAIRHVLGDSVPVSSTKPLTGHLLGAAGAVETVLCLMAMEQGYAPPTLNLEELDSDCALNFVPDGGLHAEIRACLSLNYGFGGHIGALLMEKADWELKLLPEYERNKQTASIIGVH